MQSLTSRMIPKASPNPTNSDDTGSDPMRFRSSIQSAVAYGVWGAGSLLLSLLVLVDFLIGTRLPGGMIYVAFVLGPILGIGAALATKHSTLGKIYLIITTLCLLPIQFIVIGLVLASTSGIAGTQ